MTFSPIRHEIGFNTGNNMHRHRKITCIERLYGNPSRPADSERSHHGDHYCYSWRDGVEEYGRFPGVSHESIANERVLKNIDLAARQNYAHDKTRVLQNFVDVIHDGSNCGDRTPCRHRCGVLDRNVVLPTLKVETKIICSNCIGKHHRGRDVANCLSNKKIQTEYFTSTTGNATISLDKQDSERNRRNDKSFKTFGDDLRPVKLSTTRAAETQVTLRDLNVIRNQLQQTESSVMIATTTQTPWCIERNPSVSTCTSNGDLNVATEDKSTETVVCCECTCEFVQTDYSTSISTAVQTSALTNGQQVSISTNTTEADLKANVEDKSVETDIMWKDLHFTAAKRASDSVGTSMGTQTEVSEVCVSIEHKSTSMSRFAMSVSTQFVTNEAALTNSLNDQKSPIEICRCILHESEMLLNDSESKNSENSTSRIKNNCNICKAVRSLFPQLKSDNVFQQFDSTVVSTEDKRFNGIFMKEHVLQACDTKVNISISTTQHNFNKSISGNSVTDANSENIKRAGSLTNLQYNTHSQNCVCDFFNVGENVNPQEQEIFKLTPVAGMSRDGELNFIRAKTKEQCTFDNIDDDGKKGNTETEVVTKQTERNRPPLLATVGEKDYILISSKQDKLSPKVTRQVQPTKIKKQRRPLKRIGLIQKIRSLIKKN